MNFETWEPVYEAILSDLGFDRRADERARDELADLAEPFDEGRLAPIEGAPVAVAGAGPSLAEELETAADAAFVIAASTAAPRLLDAGVSVDLMVTDLDGAPETARELTHRGIPVAVHAHGDNRPAIRKHVPRFDPGHVLATTQAAPAGPVRNFGGFTDGDRGAFLADAFGADRLAFPGWDFDDPTVTTMKRRKLRWAERLVHWLETRRGERFGLLDGRREAIDPIE